MKGTFYIFRCLPNTSFNELSPNLDLMRQMMSSLAYCLPYTVKLSNATIINELKL